MTGRSPIVETEAGQVLYLTRFPFKRCEYSMNRETWLNKLAERMAPRFEELGHPLPPFRVSIGFTSGGIASRTIGECWNKTTSADERFEIFICPSHEDSVHVAATLAHELAHAAVGLDCGHKGAFADVVLALGLRRPLTATTPGPEFEEWVRPMIAKLGPIPHAPIRWRAAGRRRTVERGAGGVVPVAPEAPQDAPGADSSRPPKQSTRLLKCECTECGYTVRTTAKWLEVGPPHCPLHGAMEVTEKETPA